ncbi:MAG: sigma-70 family RNA polymerase sigma factor [Luteitalea sp.]|nr:sigma-70 family RNA polymerase sigma factor [Luteitalea sp.]
MSVTETLLARGRAGDPDAINLLFERCLPPLARWAHGRVPAFARDLVETNDIVQDTVLRTLRRLDQFECRHAGGLLAYLRQAVENRIRDVIRRARRRPMCAEISEEQLDSQASPLEVAIGREAVERYEVALSQLKPSDRELIVARVELQYTFRDMVGLLGKPSPDAARVAVSRALLRLARVMVSLPAGARRQDENARDDDASREEIGARSAV